MQENGLPKPLGQTAEGYEEDEYFEKIERGEVPLPTAYSLEGLFAQESRQSFKPSTSGSAEERLNQEFMIDKPASLPTRVRVTGVTARTKGRIGTVENLRRQSEANASSRWFSA